ncbi:GDP-mannose mannosyl hydrolase [Arcobacter sp. YIC-464]|uniref:GDP-mannose mannosyl hydrolase n=1 Tax=Arcobacter sp. YIC-464 TaxID=3376631 RepID=UPI003C183792
MFLEKDIFSSIIENTPLISIDLIVKNSKDEILLGQRLNKPAKGSWFVPGGRIYKDEPIEKAFKRLTLGELGKEFNINKASFKGIYQHFYNDNVFNDKFSTHYIALGFELEIKEKLSLDRIQHEKQRWFNIQELLESQEVYDYVKDYFIKEKGIRND